MDQYALTVSPSTKWTRILLTHGPDEILRAVLPPPSQVRHERAAVTLIEGLSLWLDSALPVVLSAGAQDASFWLGLTDEMGTGVHSLFYRVDVVERGGHRRRGTRIRGVGDFGDLRRQLCLVPDWRS